MVKILAICRGGNCRSVALAYLCRYEFGHDAIAYGWEKGDSSTLSMLCTWADFIVVMQKEFVCFVPKEFGKKIRICDVGEDRWCNSFNPELLGIIKSLWPKVLDTGDPKMGHDSEDKKYLKIDLACGQNKQPGYWGVDIWEGPGVDQVVNLEQYPWPWVDNSVSDLFCSHYIEHVSDLIPFMEECYRILVPDGKLVVLAPYYTSMRCWQDPTHKQAISEASFLYYNAGWRQANRLTHYPIKSDFDFGYSYILAPEWAGRSPEAQQFAIRHYWNVVSDIHLTLTKRKM